MIILMIILTRTKFRRSHYSTTAAADSLLYDASGYISFSISTYLRLSSSNIS